MNKRQAKKNRSHGFWKSTKAKTKAWFGGNLITIPRWRKIVKWIPKWGCSACKHSDELDGEYCYECVKGNEYNFERRLRNEHRKSKSDF